MRHAPVKPRPIASLVAALLMFGALLALLHVRDPLFALLHISNPGAVRNYSLIVLTCLWLAGALIVSRLVEILVWDLLVAQALNSPVPGALKALGGIVIFLITATCIVGVVFDRSVTGFLAALGAGSFALGLALRNLFADIFMGLAVNLDRTFRIGDWIELSERSGVTTTGQIDEIGWRSTHLRTEDLKMVVIPNSYLGMHRITKVSPAPTRYQTTITIDFSVPVNRAKRVLLASLHAVHDLPGFSTENQPEVITAEANDRGLDYWLRYWIVPWAGISPNRARDVVTASVMEHLRTAGISPAYDKQDIFHRDMPARNWDGHTREDQLALLARLDLFSMLDQPDIERIADSIKRRSFRSGEALFQQGDPGDSLFILTEGLLDVSVHVDGNGASQRVGRVLPGEFVGEMSIFTGEPRSATIRAVTACVAYEIKGEAVHSLIETRPQIAELLSQVIAERKLRNAETTRRLSKTDHAEEVASFAGQLLLRMRNFLSRGRVS